jgi:hypothetical protein
MNAVDMSQFIAARSDQLNADDLMDSPRTITITKVTAQPDAAEQPVSIHYEGDQGKPLKPCKTVRRILVGVWGKDASKYVGRSMTIYRDPNVAFGGLQVGGIRVSHMSHIDQEKTVALQVTRGRKAPFKILPLKAEQPKPGAAYDTEEDPAAIARAKAEDWTEKYIAAVKACPAIEQLMERQAKSAETLAKLATEHDDLHELAVNANKKRASELQETAEGPVG